MSYLFSGLTGVDDATGLDSSAVASAFLPAQYKQKMSVNPAYYLAHLKPFQSLAS